MTVKDLLIKYNLTQTGLSKRLNIPLRTVQNWCSETSNHRDCPPYVLAMMETILDHDLTITPQS